MREDVIDVLLRLRLLAVVDDDDEQFDRLVLLGDFARLLGAKDELGEALVRWNRTTQSPAREA